MVEKITWSQYHVFTLLFGRQLPIRSEIWRLLDTTNKTTKRVWRAILVSSFFTFVRIYFFVFFFQLSPTPYRSTWNDLLLYKRVFPNLRNCVTAIFSFSDAPFVHDWHLCCMSFTRQIFSLGTTYNAHNIHCMYVCTVYRIGYFASKARNCFQCTCESRPGTTHPSWIIPRVALYSVYKNVQDIRPGNLKTFQSTMSRKIVFKVKSIIKNWPQSKI